MAEGQIMHTIHSVLQDEPFSNDILSSSQSGSTLDKTTKPITKVSDNHQCKKVVYLLFATDMQRFVMCLSAFYRDP